MYRFNLNGDKSFTNAIECNCIQYFMSGGRDSSVGIATLYGLDGPGIDSRWR